MKKPLNLKVYWKTQSRREFLKKSALAGSLFLVPGFFSGEKINPDNERQNILPKGTDPLDPLLVMGLLDVTKSPYFADPKGKTDATDAIQKAVNAARDAGIVCFFPEGTYLISDTISCSIKMRKVDPPMHVDGGTEHYMPIQTPIVLMGSTKGKRPVIKLSKDAKGFDDPANPKKAIWIWAQTYFDAPGKEEPIWGKEQGNISFNHFFIGIDIDVRGHSGAIGIRHSGSQGSSMLNSTIYAGGAYSGMNNCCGQGGGTYNIEVIGGQHGITIDSDSRFPILNGCIFRDQIKDCVLYNGATIQVPSMFIGCLFKPESKLAIDMSGQSSHGGINIIDSVFELKPEGVIASSKKTENIFIENSHFFGSGYISTGGTKISPSGKWKLIEQFSSHNNQGVNFVNGVETEDESVKLRDEPVAPVYEDIRKVHYIGIPSFEDSDAVNVFSYGAKGDGKTDDTEAFRKAIAASDKIFIPKGKFILSGTLALEPKTHLFGLTRSFTSIGSGTVTNRRFMIDDGKTADPAEKNTFTLTTPDDANATPGLTFLSVQGEIEWRSGKGIWNLAAGSPAYSGNAGGRFYAGGMGKGHTLDGIKNPMSLYTLNIERVLTNPQSEIKNCSHIRIYYFKVESGTIQPGSPQIDKDANTPCRISNSSDIRVYCMYGNVKKLVDRPMLDIVNSERVMICQLKAFTSGNFPHIRETWNGKMLEIPSLKTCAIFKRD
jgi:hypothetical protein